MGVQRVVGAGSFCVLCSELVASLEVVGPNEGAVQRGSVNSPATCGLLGSLAKKADVQCSSEDKWKPLQELCIRVISPILMGSSKARVPIANLCCYKWWLAVPLRPSNAEKKDSV